MNKFEYFCICRNISLDKVNQILKEKNLTVKQAIDKGIFGDMCQRCVPYLKKDKKQDR